MVVRRGDERLEDGSTYYLDDVLTVELEPETRPENQQKHLRATGEQHRGCVPARPARLSYAHMHSMR